MQAHRPRPVGERGVVGREHPALAGRDGLRRVEAEGAGPADRAGEPAVERGDRRRERVRGVLDDRHVTGRAEQAAEVRRQAPDVDDFDRPRPVSDRG